METINIDDYSIAISNLLSLYSIDKIFYGIGLPTSKHSKQSEAAAYLVDSIVGIEESKEITVLYNPHEIAFE